jgi:2-hydroxychromene-2-carboxylate isomerase
MPAPIDFYFDFSSPYGYIAAEKIDALAAKHGRTANWRPMLLGAAFKLTGSQPLPSIPIKGEYAKRDFLRSARFHAVAMKMPRVFPISGLAGCRAFYSLKDEKQRIALARALFHALFVDDVNIGEAENVLKVADSLGFKPDIASPEIKEKTKAEVDAAIAKGVFGSPYFVVDGEPFWGIDRFDQLERWLQKPF